MKRKFLAIIFFIHIAFGIYIREANAQTVFTVGTGGTHTTIKAAYTACSTATNYIIEVKSSYAGETYPISLTNLVNLGSNSVIIRPQVGVTGFTFNSATNTIFNFNNASRVTIDGRPGGVGTSGVWTIQNTSTGVSANTIQFINGSSTNTIIYCNIYGSSTGSSAASGVILFGTTTGSYGNSSNAIRYSTIGKDNVTNMPYQVVSCNQTSGKSNMDNHIENNNIINFSGKGIYLDSISCDAGFWTIDYNNFYQTANYSTGSSIIMIDIGATSSWTFSCSYNNLGGQAPNCGGNPFTIPSSSTSQFTGIMLRTNLSSTTGYDYELATNVISNISLTTTATTGIPFIGVENRSPGKANVGSVGSKCTVINNATAGTYGFVGVRNTGAGTMSVGRTIGGFKLSGSNAGANSFDVQCLSGTVNSYTTIGGDTINSNASLCHVYCGPSGILNAGGSIGAGTLFNSSGSFSAVKNLSPNGLSFGGTIYNISLPLSANTTELIGIDNQAGPLSVGYSSFYNITSANNAPISLIKHIGTTATVQTSNFYSISNTNAGAGAPIKLVILNTASSCIVNNNIFGNTTVGNISAVGNTAHNLVSNLGSGGLTANYNTFRNISLGNGAASTTYAFIYASTGIFTCDHNDIQNCIINTTSTADFAAIYSSAPTNTITNNKITNLQFTNTGAVATLNQSILTAGSAAGNLTGNIITGCSNAATSITAKIIGIDINSGSWNLYNNVVLLNNNATTNGVNLYGVWLRNAAGAHALYHNTIKIYGTQIGNALSATLFRSAAATCAVKNNVFQNLRTGGTLGHYTENTIAGGYTSDYNYMEASNVNQLASYAAVDKTLTTWKTIALANNSITGTTTLDAIGKQPVVFVGSNSGTNLNATVPTDIIGASHPATPSLGAYQYVVTISISSFTPLNGSIGTSVTITGLNFSATAVNNVVRIGGIKATVTSATTTQLIVTVPAGVTYNTITVVANGQVAQSLNYFLVTNGSNCTNFDQVVPTVSKTNYSGLVGDFNSDGNPDIVTRASDGTDLFFGNGTGQYSSYTILTPFGGGPNPSFVTEDFNRDGFSDLATLQGATVGLNSGTGTFLSGQNILTAGSQAVVVDLNKDGILDWVSVDGTNLNWAYGVGSEFGVVNSTPASGSQFLKMADVNNDTYPDALVCNSTANISVFLGSSSGTFATSINYSTGAYKPLTATIGDFDKDGDMDIAIAAGTSGKAFSVLLNAGLYSGTFPSQVDYVSTSRIDYIVAGDFNGNGNLDIAASNYDEGTVSVYFGSGTGTFGTRNDFYVMNKPERLSIGDFNKDGKQDILCVSGSFTSFVLLLSSCSNPKPIINSFSPASGPVGTSIVITGSNFSATPASNTVYIGNVKATVTAATTTQLSITVPAGSTLDKISVIVGDKSGETASRFNVTTSIVTCLDAGTFSSKVDWPGQSNINALAVGDLNGDGKKDFVAANNGSNSVSVYMNTSTALLVSFAAPVTITTGASTFDVDLGDLDLDGNVDMVVSNGNKFITVFRNTGAGTFSAGVNFTVGAAITTSDYHCAIGDIDSDGKPDIIVGLPTSYYISILKNTSSAGTLNASSFTAFVDLISSGAHNSIALGNILGDIRPEFIHSYSNYFSVKENQIFPNALNLYQWMGYNNNISNASTGTDLFVTDIDGDGKLDIAVSGNPGVRVYLNNSTGSIASFTPYSVTATGNYTGMSMGDIDGDGKPDISACYSNASGYVSIFKNNSTVGSVSFGAKFDYALGTGVLPKDVLLADFNQDGKPEMIVGSYTNANKISLFKNRVKPTAVLSGTTSICNGASANLTLNLTGAGGWLVTYTDGVTNTTLPKITTTPYTFSVAPTSTKTYSIVSVTDSSGCAGGAVSGTATVTVNTIPTVSTVTGTTRCGVGTAVISGTVSSGAINWYAVQTGGTIQPGGSNVLSFTTPTLSSNTSFWAEAISPQGCPSAARTKVDVVVTAMATITSTSPGFLCAPGSQTISVTSLIPQARVRWYTVATGGTVLSGGDSVLSYTTPSLSSTQTYYVDATYNGCTSTPRTAINANVNTIPVVLSTTPASNCGPGNVLISVTVDVGNVTWYDAPTGGSIKCSFCPTLGIIGLATTTTYYAEVNNNGCMPASRTPVIASIISTPSITSTTPAIRCDAGTVTLTAVATGASTPINWYSAPSGGSPLSGSSISSTNPTTGTFVTPVISATTSYYVEAGISGCATGRQLVVATVNNSPTISSVTGAQNCGSGSVSLSANSATSGVAYNWYANASGGSSLNSIATYSIPNLTTTTTYYVDVTINGCKSPRSPVTAMIYPIPAFTLTSTNPTACAIADGSFSLNGLAANTNYNFVYNGGASQIISTDALGTYKASSLLSGSYLSMIVTDIVNNCTYSNGGVSLVDPGAPSIDAGNAQIVCQGDFVTLTALNPNGANLLWSTSAITSSINFVASGSSKTIYSVTANLAGCISSDTVSVTVRSNQTVISFPTIPTKDISDLPFSISAGVSSGLPVSFTSLNTSVAAVSGSTITIVGPGTAYIKMSQSGNSCYNPLIDSIQSFPVSGTINQVVTFPSIPTIYFGDLPFDPGATVGSGLPIIYVSSDSTIAKIVNGKLIGIKSGSAVISAFVNGAPYYNPSDTVMQTVNVIVPPFIIFGRKIVEENSLENYFISPNSASKYTYAWKYLGSRTYFDSDTVSRNVALGFSHSSTDDSLRCRVYSIASGGYVDVFLSIKVNHQIQDNVIVKINCDSLKGTFTICSGKYINDFIMETFAGDLVNYNSYCDQGYSDYTRAGFPYTGELYLGESYNAKVRIGKQSISDLSANYIGVWLDYNNNGSFEDANEFLLSTYSNDSIIELKNLLINSNEEYKGAKRLRVRVRSSGLFSYDESCYDYNESGETEDYKITLVVPDRLEAPVLLTPDEDGKNDLFIIKGIKTNEKSKLTILDRYGNVLHTASDYDNKWDGKDKEGKTLPRDTYYYNFVNGNDVIRGFFEIRY